MCGSPKPNAQTVILTSVCVYQWDMANGGDQFGLAERPDSDCMDSPKETKQENHSYPVNSPASPQTASSQQVPGCAVEHNVNIPDYCDLTNFMRHHCGLMSEINETNKVLMWKLETKHSPQYFLLFFLE